MNIVKIDLKIETEVYLSSNGEFFIKERPVAANSFVSVYITYGNVSCYLGTIEDRWELFEIAGPDNLMEVLDCRLSEYQWDVIYDALDESNFEYYIGDKVYVAKNNKN